MVCEVQREVCKKEAHICLKNSAKCLFLNTLVEYAKGLHSKGKKQKENGSNNSAKTLMDINNYQEDIKKTM